MKTAIIGLPMTGKTSLFTILTGVHQETRIGSTAVRTGIAKVPDSRLDALATLFEPPKVTHAVVEYLDMPSISKETLRDPAYVASHWESVEIGAARTGRTPRRRDWRLVREIFVADTDAEAMRLSAGGMMGRQMREYFLPLLASFGFTEFLKHRPDVPDSDVTPEYCARHNWLVGSPATVTERLHQIYEQVGGFGTLLLFCFDYADESKAWRHSMELLAREVMPKFKGLVP